MIDKSQRVFSFVAGEQGPWSIQSNTALVGESLPDAERLAVIGHPDTMPDSAPLWSLQGVTSNERYVTRDEKTALVARQAEPGRPSANCGAFIALRKNPQWWALTQDERRSIVEEQSHHIALGMNYLPAIARRLFHCRDLPNAQPFDFLTWFEFNAADAGAFNELLGLLRGTLEWQFVEREVDMRLIRGACA
jgi:hypothetical protein